MSSEPVAITKYWPSKIREIHYLVSLIIATNGSVIWSGRSDSKSDLISLVTCRSLFFLS